MDLLAGKKLQGAFMGGNRFPVDIPRLVDFYLRGLLDLDSIVAETHPARAGQRRLREDEAGDGALRDRVRLERRSGAGWSVG